MFYKDTKHTSITNEKILQLDAFMYSLRLQKTGYWFNTFITNPDFNLGSNHVDFGGIIFPESVIAINWFNETE